MVLRLAFGMCGVAALLLLANVARAQEPNLLAPGAKVLARQVETPPATDEAVEGAESTEAEDEVGPVENIPLPLRTPRQFIPPLAYNYYYPAPGAPHMPARLYMAPRPTPERIGYTYITHQAFAPHEFLYRHRAWYYRIHPGSGVTLTKITWR